MLVPRLQWCGAFAHRVGHARKPPVFLRPGDVSEVEIEGIGILRNPVVSA